MFFTWLRPERGDTRSDDAHEFYSFRWVWEANPDLRLGESGDGYGRFSVASCSGTLFLSLYCPRDLLARERLRMAALDRYSANHNV